MNRSPKIGTRTAVDAVPRPLFRWTVQVRALPGPRGHIGNGGLTVHFTTGGNDHEQLREDDTLAKDERWARTRGTEADVYRLWGEPLARTAEQIESVRAAAAAVATGGAGNSNALVGTPETVAHALLDHHDLGVDIISARGHDLLDDAIELGRHVIPLVREEVAERDAELAAEQVRAS